MIYGYIRVSTLEQNVDRQVKSMDDLGVDESRLYIDKASGKNFDRPKYRELMGKVSRGDKIVVDSLDRLGRDYDGLISEWKRLTHDEGIDIQALDMTFMNSEYFRNMGDLGKLVEDIFVGILSWVAEHERLENHRRTMEGIAVAKAAGKFKGGVKKRLPEGALEAAQAALDGGASKAEVARMLGVHPNTVFNMLKDGRLVA